MTTYRAQVTVDDGMLHTSRPLLAPDPVGDMVDSLVWAVQQHHGDVTSAELVIETSGESATPIGDSIAGTSSTPLPADDDDDADDVEALPVSVPTLGGQS
jgi:hypothetical protein